MSVKTTPPQINISCTYVCHCVTPTILASVYQCLGCGQRRPARISAAYGLETPRAEAIVEYAIPATRGWILCS